MTNTNRQADVVQFPKSATRKAVPRKRPAPKAKVATGIVAQVRLALAAENRLATLLGALLGALVPVATFAVAHVELAGDWRQPLAILVAGGLLYSATTVYQWGRLAFGSWYKALGFAVLIEGVMTFSTVGWLSAVALGYLACINAIATGATLALGAPKKE
jgi:VIT1/CCC1 family predicted Fe2+/Mn2+ transporter